MKNYNDFKSVVEKLNETKKQINKEGKEILASAIKENGGEIELEFDCDETVGIDYGGNDFGLITKIYLDKNDGVMVDFEEEFGEDSYGFSAISTDEQVELIKVVFEKVLPRLANKN